MQGRLVANRRRFARRQPARAPALVAENLRGAAFMVAAMTVYMVNDATMKFVAMEFPLYQSIAMRNLFAAGFLLIAFGLFDRMSRRQSARSRAGHRITNRDRFLIALRMMSEVASTLLYLTALTHMGLGDLGAIIQATPLLVMLAAALFLGETIGWRRLAAVGVGMAGMLIILRPGTPRFDGWALMALASVLLVAARDIFTRMLSAQLPPLPVALTTAVGVMIFAGVMSLGEGWVMPGLRQVALLAMAAAFISVGYVTVIMAMRIGDVAFITPFRYISLVVAVVLGYLMFDEFPDLWVWVGAALIVGAGLFAIWRETRQNSAAGGG